MIVVCASHRVIIRVQHNGANFVKHDASWQYHSQLRYKWHVLSPSICVSLYLSYCICVSVSIPCSVHARLLLQHNNSPATMLACALFEMFTSIWVSSSHIKIILLPDHDARRDRHETYVYVHSNLCWVLYSQAYSKIIIVDNMSGKTGSRAHDTIGESLKDDVPGLRMFVRRRRKGCARIAKGMKSRKINDNRRDSSFRRTMLLLPSWCEMNARWCSVVHDNALHTYALCSWEATEVGASLSVTCRTHVIHAARICLGSFDWLWL